MPTLNPEALNLDAGPAELLASLGAALSRPLAAYDLLLIGTGRNPAGGSRVVLAELSPDEGYLGSIYGAVDALDEQGVTDALLIEHGGRFFADRRDFPPSALAYAGSYCTQAGIAVRDALTIADRPEGRRWRSLACTDPACCPPEGNPFPETGANPS